MLVDLHYGTGLVQLDIPDHRLQQVIRPWHSEQGPGSEGAVRKALAADATPAFQSAIAHKHVCLLVDDGTRDEPYRDLFGPLLETMTSCASIRALICTGTHEPDTRENRAISDHLKQVADGIGISNFEVRAHDCEADAFVNAGRTSRGTEVIFNAAVQNADVFVVLSDVKVHYFAGYSNPIKNLVPGVCAYKTTEQNHSLALDVNSTHGQHPWHPDPARRSNPLAEDQLEAMRTIIKDRPIFALVTLSTAGQVNWAKFGPAQETTAEAFLVADRENTYTVNPVSRLIVSPGEYPNDASLYIAQRALELTKTAVTDGGEVLFLAACQDGIGEKRTIENFYNRLTAPLDEVLRSIEDRYVLYGHKPYKFAQMIRRLRRIWAHSQIPDPMIEAAHLYPSHDPQAVVDRWLTEDPEARIIAVDGANKIALYARGG